MSELKDLESVIKDANSRMKKTIQYFEDEMARVRTGRASPALVENIKVNYYGSQMPMNQVSNISVPDSKTILIQPWDPGAVEPIEKAIIQSDLGINPNNDGKVIRLSIPPLTEERRKELAKYVSNIAEDNRISVRQIRKDSNNHIKDLEKEEGMPEDQCKKALSDVQDLTDKYIEEINKLLERKEKEIMEI